MLLLLENYHEKSGLAIKGEFIKVSEHILNPYRLLILRFPSAQVGAEGSAKQCQNAL